jgi:hypothetical protein
MRFFHDYSVSVFPKQALALPDSAIRLRELMYALTAHAEAEKSRNA